MSQITRCPHCQTAFKVVDDQLRVAEGWVRCGRCKQIFDAFEGLVDMDAPVQAPPPLLPPLPPEFTSPSAVGPAAWVASSWPETVAQAQSPTGSAERLAADAFSVNFVADDLVEADAELPDDGPGLPLDLGDAAAAPGRSEPALLPIEQTPWFIGAAVPEPQWTSESKPEPAPMPYAEFEPEAVVELDPDRGPEAESAPAPELGPQPQAPAEPGPAFDGAPEGGVEAEREHAPGAEAESPMEPEPLFDRGSEPDAEAELGRGQQLQSRSESALRSEPEPGLDAADVAPQELANKSAARSRRKRRSGAGRDPAFVRAARRGAFWRKPLVRAALVGVCMALAVALALQMTVRERAGVAARYPQAGQWLELVCKPLGCTVDAPRRIDDVVIDASAFTRLRAGEPVYALQLSVKNGAELAVAMPDFELTLIDAAEQPIVRRVFRAAELGAPATLTGRGVWSGSAQLRMLEGAARVTGYRLLAFYP